LVHGGVRCPAVTIRYILAFEVVNDTAIPALVAALNGPVGNQLQNNLNAAAALFTAGGCGGGPVKVAVLPENFAVLASDQMAFAAGKQEGW